MIATAYTMAMTGSSQFMVDSCGSLGPLDEELCARWMQVAAFMPMLRDHYNATYLSKDGTR